MLCWSQTQPGGLVCLSLLPPSLVHISSAAPRTARGQEGALGPRALQGVLRTDPLQHVSLLQHSSSLGRILCPIFFFHFSCFPVPARARSEQPAAARCRCAERVAQLCCVRGALGTEAASRWPPFASCPSALGQFYPLTWDLVIGREAGEIQEPRVWFVGSRWSVC